VNDIDSLLAEGPIAVNVGLGDLAESLAAQNVRVVEIDWAPPQELDDDLAELLEALE
jgi:hypothetical protein